MIKKKNRFLTWCCSLVPGAGHMYLGFMKQGISVAALFWGTIFLTWFLRLEFLVFTLPIVWMYAFFDVNNKKAMDNEEFYQLEDDYLFKNSGFSFDTLLKHRKVAAGACIFIGLYVLWNNFVDLLYSLLPSQLMNVIYYGVFRKIPQILFAIIIIYIGYRLIVGKRVEYIESNRGDQDGENN